jgi:sugar transferase (PEP-CTERM system associated)
MGGDAFLAVLALLSGTLLIIGTLDWQVLSVRAAQALIFCLVLLLTGYLAELYDPGRLNDWKELLLRLGTSLLLAFFALSVWHFLGPASLPGRRTLLISLLLFGIFQYLWHSRYPSLLRMPGVAQNVLIFGSGPVADQIKKLLEGTNHHYRLAGSILPSGEMAGGPPLSSAHGMEELVCLAQQAKVSKIVISLSERRGVLPVKDILGCKLDGIDVVDAMSFYEQITGKLMIERINPSWFIFSNGFRVTTFTRFYKRSIDLLFASLGLLLFLPLAPVIALLVRLDSPGPAFFRQQRVGKGEKPFMLIKFRTMRQDAEEQTGAVWAAENDPRVTRLGRFLRATRLDEVPQLVNVIKGEMSLVGPRPERPEFVEQLKEKIPYYSNRHCVKPGATGWAQVKYSYGASVADAMEKLRYDLYYIKNYSLFLDLLIILETVKVVLCGRGAR